MFARQSQPADEDVQLSILIEFANKSLTTSRWSSCRESCSRSVDYATEIYLSRHPINQEQAMSSKFSRCFPLPTLLQFIKIEPCLAARDRVRQVLRSTLAMVSLSIRSHLIGADTVHRFSNNELLMRLQLLRSWQRMLWFQLVSPSWRKLL